MMIYDPVGDKPLSTPMITLVMDKSRLEEVLNSYVILEIIHLT